MITADKIANEKLQHGINRAAAKIPALSTGKLDKYDHLTGEEILPPQKNRILQRAKLTYFSNSPGKAFGKERKPIEEQGENQGEAL